MPRKNDLKALLRPVYRELRRTYLRARFGTRAQIASMERDWDQRAIENARHFVATGKDHWTDEEFFASGEKTVADHILTDMVNICRTKPPASMRVLEIGCGAGRVTRALARMFGEVHAVDVSGEMVRQARLALSQYPNAKVYRNNGTDLSVVPALPFDFAFSALVFQHIPSYPIVRNYVRETHRLLAPGALFKFQVRGNTEDKTRADETWVGVPISEEQAVRCANECGFEARYRVGAGTEEFWLWYFKQDR